MFSRFILTMPIAVSLPLALGLMEFNIERYFVPFLVICFVWGMFSSAFVSQLLNRD